jgi:type 1 glutamine amidotransferase/sugar phosphate isomerase/epimerase
MNRLTPSGSDAFSTARRSDKVTSTVFPTSTLAKARPPLTRRQFLARAAATTACLAATPWCSLAAAAAVSEEQRQKIEAALPEKAFASPRRPRKLLIFDLNVNYGGHGSIPTANHAFTRMGQKTGAFETVISRDPAVFQPASLRQFDAVFFNNNVGNCFTDSALRQSLVDFVYAGGGLMGVHGASVAFTQWPGAVEDWPEFGLMIGARGANHKANNEHVFIKLEEPDHPLNQAAGGQDFDYRDEFFRVHEPYSRHRLRILWSMDTTKTDMNQQPAYGKLARPDNDYALAWVRNYGRGRTFYCTVAHHPAVFWDARMLRFYLGAAQFVLGDLPAPTIPSARLTPALRAQEKLGWRLGLEAYTFHKFTLFESIEKTAQLGLPYLGGLSFQKVSHGIPKNLEPGLSDEELRQIRFKLDDAGVRLLTYYIQDIPGDEAGCRRLFEFGRKLGIETFMSEPKPEALDTIEKFCDAYDLNVALHNHDPKASPHYWNPEGILKVCQGRSQRLGACADIGYWMRAGLDPIEGVRKLKDRLLTIQMHDLHTLSADGHDVPWGTGAGQAEAFIKEVHRLGLKPTMWGLEYSYNFLESLPDIAKCIEFFNKVSLELATGGTR